MVCRPACSSGRRTGAQLDVGHVLEIDEGPGTVLDDDVSNCSVFSSRPRVVMMYCDTCPLGVGGWPIWPAATWMFCACTAAITSWAFRLYAANFCGSSHSAHAVIALAEIGDVADAGQTRQLIADLDGGVVAQFEAGAAVVLGERLTIISTLGDFFLTEMPRRLTRSGNIGSASDSRFCTSTCEMLRSVPG